MRELTFLVLATLFGDSCRTGFPPISNRIVCATRTLEKNAPPLVWSAALHGDELSGFAAFNANDFGTWKRGLFLPEVGDKMRFIKGEAVQSGFDNMIWSVRLQNGRALIEHRTTPVGYGFFWEAICSKSQEKCDPVASQVRVGMYAFAYTVCQQGRLNDIPFPLIFHPTHEDG